MAAREESDQLIRDCAVVHQAWLPEYCSSHRQFGMKEKPFRLRAQAWEGKGFILTTGISVTLCYRSHRVSQRAV